MELENISIAVTVNDYATAEISKISSALSGLSTAGTAAAGGVEQTGAAAKTTAGAIAKTGTSASSAATKITKVGKAVDDLTSAGFKYVSLPIAAAATASVKAFTSYETAITGVAKTTNATDEELETISDDLKELALNVVPKSSTELANMAAIAGQLGVAKEDIAEFTHAMADLDVSTNVNGETGALQMAQFMNIMGESSSDVRRVASSIVELGNNTATTEADILEMATRMARYSKTVGISTQDTLAYSAALASMGVNAQAGGTSIGRVWQDIETAVASGSDDIQAYAQYAGLSADEFAAKWSTDPSGAFYGLIEGLAATENLTLALSDMGISNAYDVQSIEALVARHDILTDALEMSNTAYEENTALTNEASRAYDTTAAKIQFATEAVTQAGQAVGGALAPTVEKAAEAVKNAAVSFSELDEEQQESIVKTAAVTAGGLALANGTGKVIKGVGETAKNIKTLSSIMGSAASKAAPAAGAIKGIGSALATVGAAAAPAIVGLAGAAVVAGGAYAAAKIYIAYREKKENEWIEDLANEAAALKEHKTLYNDLSSIQRDLIEQQKIIDDPESSEESVSGAKSRIEYLVDILNDEYSIQCDSSNIDEALAKAVKLQEILTRAKATDLASRVASGKDDYKDTLEDYEGYKEAFEGYTEAYAKALDFISNYDNAGLSKNSENYVQTVKELAALSGIDLSGVSTANALEAVIENNRSIIRDYEDSEGKAQEVKSLMDEAQSKIDDYIAASKELADTAVTQMQIDALGGSETSEETWSWLKDAVDSGAVSLEEYTAKAAAAKQGVSSLNEVWAEGGEAVDNAVADYINIGERLGMTAQATAKGAALIKNGFSDIESAANAGKLDDVAVSFANIANGLNIGIEDINRFAHSLGILPDEKHIEIDADGNFEVIEGVQDALDGIDDKQATVTVNTVGTEGAQEAKTAIDGVEDKQATVTVNAEIAGASGGEFGAGLGDRITQRLQAELSSTAVTAQATAKVTFEKDTTEIDGYTPDNKPAKVEYSYDASAVDIWTPPPKYGTVIYTAKLAGTQVATGTADFAGGAAIVNDQAGNKYKELIQTPAQQAAGTGVIYSGRNVALTLPAHTRVWNAADTERILSGIPHYASGTSNPDLTEEEEEEIKRIYNELKSNKSFDRSMGYITDEDYYSWLVGYRDENLRAWSEEYQDATLELKEYRDEQIQDRISASKDWLSHEEEYNELSQEDYIAGLNRIKAYLAEYFDEGALSWEDYAEEVNEINDTIADRTKEQIQDRISVSKDWLSHEEEYNNLSEADYIAGLNRIKAYLSEYLAEGVMSWEDYAQEVGEINDAIADKAQEAYQSAYEDWQKSAENWKDIRDTLDDWEEAGDSVTAYYERCIERVGELWAAGIIGWDEYSDAALSYTLDKFTAEKEEITAYYQGLIDEIDSDWDEADRSAQIADLQEKVADFSGAVTSRGRAQYEEYVEELNALLREQEQAELEEQMAADIAALSTSYREQIEDGLTLSRDEIEVSDEILTISESIRDLVSGLTQSVSELNETVANYTENSNNSTVYITAADATEIDYFTRSYSAIFR